MNSTNITEHEQAEEQVAGYVVDIACLRKYPASELLERARVHTKKCILMGHCVESGYGLVRDDGTIIVLDTDATPMVVDAMRRVPGERGIRLLVMRREKDGEMRTISVEGC